jgi:hypothetical protein
MVGYYISYPGWVVGYSVDAPTKNGAIFGGTHEVMLQYMTNIGCIIGCEPGDWWPKSDRFL